MKIAFHCQLTKFIFVQTVLLLTDALLGQAATENGQEKGYQHDDEGSSWSLWFRSLNYEKATSALTTEEVTWMDAQYNSGDYEDPMMAIHGKKSRDNGDPNGKKGHIGKKGDNGKKTGDNGKKTGDNGKKTGDDDDDDDGTAAPTVMKPKPTPTPMRTPAPTPNPTMPPTPAAPGSSYTCVWPPVTSGFTLISKSDATSAADSHYTKIAVGGTFYDGSPTESGTVDGKIFYKSIASNVNFNFNGGKQQIADLKDVPIDFAHYEWLANNIKAGTYGDKQVFVVENAKSSCYNLYDFVNGGQSRTGDKYLVVFKTSADICFTKTSDGRQFGPTVLAPFSKVTLMGDAGYIDGTVIAKTFTTSGGNAGSLQLHGKFYCGSIECPPVASPSGSCYCKDTNSPVAYSWNCGTDLYYCANVINKICSASMQSGVTWVPLNSSQCTQMNNVKLGEKCLAVGSITNPKALSHKVCYSSLNPLTGTKLDDTSCDVCQSYTAVHI